MKVLLDNYGYIVVVMPDDLLPQGIELPNFISSDFESWRLDSNTNIWSFNPRIMVPQSISKLQCVAYLLQINRYNELMAIINADTTGVSQILFDAAAVLDRDSNMVNQIATALGFSSDDTDAFFIEASKILV